ncbi:MAG: sn-glycerol-3-phosphate ABC transporter ATP-binding protein UgpC [Acidimicrobiales bacterium]
MAEILFEHVTKIFDNGVVAVEDLDLALGDGEFLVLVGPSGCGKTTSLRMVAGLEDVTSGTLRIGDDIVNDIPAKKRDIAMVFQNYALYPHMSVRQNMGFGLRLRHVPRPQRDERVEEAARVLDLTDLLDRKPKQLSGGQRQRVAMGRAIVREPRAFLMDEPLSNLDAKLRVQMRAEIARIQRRLGVTTLYVTHDQVEAMTMGDRVAVMRRGVLQQVATPADLYERPVNLFVAGFIGSPSMNLLEGTVRLTNGEPHVLVGTTALELTPALLGRRPALNGYDGLTIAIGIRPEHLQDAQIRPDMSPRRRVKVIVELVEALGSDVMVHAAIDAKPVRTEDLREIAADLDATAERDLARTTSSFLIARCDPRTRVNVGEAFELAVDVEQMQVFDLATGSAITGSAPGTEGRTANAAQ